MEKVMIEDLYRFSGPTDLMYSPAGTYLAIEKTEIKEEEYVTRLFVSRDGVLRQLTYQDSCRLLGWYDDSRLMILKKRADNEEGITQIYLLDVTGGEAQPFLRLPLAVEKIEKADERTFVLSAAIDKNDPDAYLDDEKVRTDKREEKKKEADFQIIDELPYWFNGAGYTNGKRTALFVMKDGVLKRITEVQEDVQDWILEGQTVYAMTARFQTYRPLFSQVFSYDLKTSEKTWIYEKEDTAFRSLFVLNDILYAQLTDMKTYGCGESSVIAKLGKDSWETVYTPEVSLYGSVAGDILIRHGKESCVKNGYFYTLATVDDHTELYRFDSSFEKTVLFNESSANSFAVAPDRIALVKASSDSLFEVYEMDAQGKNLKKLTDFHEEYLKDRWIARPQRIDYVSEGLSLHGWVLLPQEYENADSVPAVLDVHGGPRAVYSDIFFHEMQVWASAGYAVFFTNIRGSDGRGDAFADIRGLYGKVDFRNLMDFTDAVLAAYEKIDPARICLTGGSYGGYMTNWAVTQTDRFCCAASQRSISNWISMTYLSDISVWFGPDQCGADSPFGSENIARLWDCSPLKYAEQVNTPILMIHSDEDYRCPLPEGMQFIQALLYRGVEARMVVFHGENHELSRSGKPAHRVRRLKEITDWFNRHTAG